MKNKILVFTVFTILFSCKKENNTINAQEKSIVSDNIKNITLPFDSKSFVYSKKDKKGYYVYDKTFKKNNYSNSLSRIYGKINLNNDIDLLFIERKPNDDEFTEPIVTLYSYNNKLNSKIDSLSIYETIEGEGNREKRFKMDMSKNIYIYENSSGYDFTNNGKEILITENNQNKYSISNNGKFVLQEKKQNTPISNGKLSPPNKTWFGSYSIKTDAISNADNKKIILKYYITINSLSDATLSVGAENPQDYNCEGDYTLQKEDDNTLSGSGICNENDINDFYIKKENDKYFIKSKRFINQDWQELKKE